jgi:hypothetical protein
LARKKRVWMIYDISLIILVFALTFYGFHYLLSRIANTETSLFLLVPTFLWTAPAAVWGYRHAYRHWYTDQPSTETLRSEKSKRTWLLVSVTMFLMGAAMLFYVLAIGFVGFRDRTTLGIICSTAALACYIGSLLAWSKIFERLLPLIDRLRERDNSSAP